MFGEWLSEGRPRGPCSTLGEGAVAELASGAEDLSTGGFRSGSWMKNGSRQRQGGVYGRLGVRGRRGGGRERHGLKSGSDIGRCRRRRRGMRFRRHPARGSSKSRASDDSKRAQGARGGRSRC